MIKNGKPCNNFLQNDNFLQKKLLPKDFPPQKLVKFPPANDADGGIVCIGGNLEWTTLYSAYLQGIFAWFMQDEPITWWSPDPRFVLLPQDLHVPKSLNKTLNKNIYRVTMDKDFDGVITQCANLRQKDGTWITDGMIAGYKELFLHGIAHSVEAYLGDELVGGLYGVLIGSVFFGESMFSTAPNASKVAFVQFVRAFADCGGKLIDSQVYTDHVARFGGKNISRDAFLHYEKLFLPQKLAHPLAL